MDYLTRRELEEAKSEKELISEELKASQNKIAKYFSSGMGEYMVNNINTPVKLTKSEKKMLRNQKKNKIIKKIKNLFIGENDTEI